MEVAGLIFGLAGAIMALLAFGVAGAAMQKAGGLERKVEELTRTMESRGKKRP